jgi:hypothetical protein
MPFRRRIGAVRLVPLAALIAAAAVVSCGSDEDGGATASGGSAGAGGASGAQVGGSAGSDGGKGGTGGAGGTGGSAAGSGGSTAGTGGGGAGAGGSVAGTGGSAAGTGGSSAGTGGSAAGTGGSSAGTGGSAGGSAGSSSGAGGTGGTGGSPPIGGVGDVAGCASPVALVDVSGAKKIGDGTAASCTEAATRAAVEAGGTYVFACGAAPLTITLGATLVVTKDLTLDGGGTVTLSGGGKSRILTIDAKKNFEALSPVLTVQRLAFTGGKASGTTGPLGANTDAGGGAIYFLGGRVVVLDSTFDANTCPEKGPDVGGGAIYGVGVGGLLVARSRFTNNACANGGAIGVLGGDLAVYSSTFTDNTATGRGANSVVDGKQVGEGGNGGAISMDGKGHALTLCGVTVKKNHGGAFGGAVFRTSYASEPTTIASSSFEDNDVPDTTDPNVPSGAGGLYLQGTHVTMTSTTIAGNKANGAAGLWVLGHGAGASGKVDLTNVTIANNETYPRPDFTKRGIPGGLIIGDDTTGTLQNCSIVGNKAQFASGIGRASPLVIHNTIIDNVAENQYAPINCTGSAFASPPGKGDHNVQWPKGLKDDMECTAGIVRIDPQMGTLADNGGVVRTVAPSPGSPVIGMGADCAPTDARGKPRKAACTLGALEVE